VAQSSKARSASLRAALAHPSKRALPRAWFEGGCAGASFATHQNRAVLADVENDASALDAGTSKWSRCKNADKDVSDEAALLDLIPVSDFAGTSRTSGPQCRLTFWTALSRKRGQKPISPSNGTGRRLLLASIVYLPPIFVLMMFS